MHQVNKFTNLAYVLFISSWSLLILLWNTTCNVWLALWTLRNTACTTTGHCACAVLYDTDMRWRGNPLHSAGRHSLCRWCEENNTSPLTKRPPPPPIMFLWENITTTTSAYVVGCWWTQDRKASCNWWQKINRQIISPAMSSVQWELDYRTLCLQSADISSKHPYPTPTLNFVNVSPEQRQWTWRAG